MEKNITKIDIIKADKLKDESQNGKLGISVINKIFEPENSSAKPKPMKLSSEFLSQHFHENQSSKEIETIISEALKLYLLSQNNSNIQNEQNTDTSFKIQHKKDREKARENNGNPD